ncbi:MAG: CPBP family intramembrane metalloprotease [Terracidiphilus sp.]|nr:CPBP family intramembrane metalloprotease [Terracidiphilus sp.]
MITPANIFAALLTLIPLVAAGFFPQIVGGSARRLPWWAQILCPAALSAPYVLVTCSAGQFRWGWFALYALLPAAVAMLLGQAMRADGEQPPQRQGPVPQPQRARITRWGLRVAGDPGGQHGSWRDFLVLAVLGLAVDLRWFEGAWPAHLAIFNKMLVLDAGIYGFIALRQLEGAGFDLRLKLRDAGIGLRELAWYTPVALVLGLGLGFLHLHRGWPGWRSMAWAWIFTFLFIAVPEELFFRGWMQNLLERRIGRTPALLVTAALFGLSHFNKRTAFFNWRYVLLGAVAGIFYGRAWRQERRVGASAVTHASVDAIWSLWLR